MNRLDGLHDRALLLDGGHLECLRWGAVQERFPVSSLEPGTIERDDNKNLFKADEQRLRIGFGSLATFIWVPLERQAEAEAFVASVGAAIAAGDA